jgi:hypothetical protein
MSTEDAHTINQLMDLFLLSRSRGEWVKLSMETKDGQDSLNFPLGTPAGKPRTWTPGNATPWTWPPQPPAWTRPQKRKSPSQWRRDQKRRQELIAKKVSNNDAKKNSNKMVIDIGEKKEDQPSLIPQIDGFCESETNQSKDIFSFKSDFPEDAIENHFDEILKNTNVKSTNIILKDQLRPGSADQLYLYTRVFHK